MAKAILERNVENAMIKFPKAKRIAVANFTAGNTWGQAAAMNLGMDAQLYKWNNDTVKAIKWVMGAIS